MISETSATGSEPVAAEPSLEARARVVIFASFSGQGGVERMLVNLMTGLVERGVAVELLLARAEGPFVERLPAAVRVRRFRAGHTAASVIELACYLRCERPASLLAVKDRAIRAAVRARWLAGVDTRVVGRLGTNLGAALAHKSRVAGWLRRAPMRRAYRHLDAVIAVSDGVADDTRAVTGLPRRRVVVVRNPVVGPKLFAEAAAASPHPWLETGESPVIVGMGRLTEQKDFATLLGAFAELRKTLACRLIIAGDGPLRGALAHQIGALSLIDSVALPGFVTAPAALLARCQLFVLSSRWEGSPNVLTEALALGTPVVATDCPSGPREILAAGRYGPLTPVGDAGRLAAAMAATLSAPPSANRLRAATREHVVSISAKHYLEVLDSPPER